MEDKELYEGSCCLKLKPLQLTNRLANVMQEDMPHRVAAHACYRLWNCATG